MVAQPSPGVISCTERDPPAGTRGKPRLISSRLTSTPPMDAVCARQSNIRGTRPTFPDHCTDLPSEPTRSTPSGIGPVTVITGYAVADPLLRSRATLCGEPASVP